MVRCPIPRTVTGLSDSSKLIESTMPPPWPASASPNAALVLAAVRASRKLTRSSVEPEPASGSSATVLTPAKPPRTCTGCPAHRSATGGRRALIRRRACQARLASKMRSLPTSFPHWETVLVRVSRLRNHREPSDLRPAANERQLQPGKKCTYDHVLPCILSDWHDQSFLQAPPAGTGWSGEPATDGLAVCPASAHHGTRQSILPRDFSHGCAVCQTAASVPRAPERSDGRRSAGLRPVAFDR